MAEVIQQQGILQLMEPQLDILPQVIPLRHQGTPLQPQVTPHQHMELLLAIPLRHMEVRLPIPLRHMEFILDTRQHMGLLPLHILQHMELTLAMEQLQLQAIHHRNHSQAALQAILLQVGTHHLVTLHNHLMVLPILQDIPHQHMDMHPTQPQQVTLLFMEFLQVRFI